MESPGKYLRKEREFRNLSLGEIHRVTKIKEHFLQAIEEDQYENLPSPFYVKGFLAHYARSLGFDPKEVISRYQEYLKAQSPPEEVEIKKEPPPPVRRVASRVLLVPALLLAVAISLSTYFILLEQEKSVPPISVEKEPMRPSTKELIQEPTQESPPSVEIEEKAKTPLIEKVGRMDIIGPKEARAGDSVSGSPLSLEVLEADIGTGIEKVAGRTSLTGKSSEIPCNNQKVYFHTRITTPKEGKITHVWLWKNEEFQKIEMEVKPPTWSVYSYMTLPSHKMGDWKVELREGDKILTHRSFKASKSTLFYPSEMQ